ncbi:MAG: type II toxin-antitoxin system RelE/ParE family toxin [Limnochordaceae bacterium]|nr:type II toxin-antitoxin system RelE/ParE family toxin [Limnochordaceae bacterium]
MAREVVWTFRALQDVEAIADYIARDSPGYGASLVARLVHAARSLAEEFRGAWPEGEAPRKRKSTR